MTAQHGKFFVFEGIDASGKTTQAKLLEAYLIQKGFDFLLTRQLKDLKCIKEISSRLGWGG